MQAKKQTGSEPTYTLENLLAGVTDENLHGEVNTGPDVGNEIWNDLPGASNMDTTLEPTLDFTIPPLEVEIYGGEPYEYHPLGKYIVMAPGVCGGRPTFKYTRIDASFILAQLSIGRTIEELVKDYNRKELSREAVQEAIELSANGVLETYAAKNL